MSSRSKLATEVLAQISSWRWDIIFAAFILALGWVLSATLPRLERFSLSGNGDFVGRFDRWTGEVCSIRVIGSEREWQAEANRNPKGFWTCRGRSSYKE